MVLHLFAVFFLFVFVIVVVVVGSFAVVIVSHRHKHDNTTDNTLDFEELFLLAESLSVLRAYVDVVDMGCADILRAGARQFKIGLLVRFFVLL